MDRTTNPRILFVLMGYSPDDNGAQATRAVSLFHEIKTYFSDTSLIMKEGENPSVEDGYNLIKPRFSLEGKGILLKGILFRVQMTLAIIRFVHKKHITSIILRGYDTILLFPFLKVQKVKIFYDFHGRYNLELSQQNRPLRAAFTRMCDKFILKHTDKILTVSEGIQSQIPEYRDKCLPLQNGVDVQAIEDAKNRQPVMDIPENEYIVGFIGNWEPVMRIDDICNAVEIIDNTTALIIGKGYNANEIFSQYRSKKTIFTGRINQKDALFLLHKMDVCIIPYDKNHYMSKINNFFSNRKVYEYLSAGKPIIVSNIEARPAFLIDNVNCLTYESGDARDLAGKISELIHNPIRAEEMSKNNTELAKKFTWKNLVEESGIVSELKLHY